MYKLNLGQIYNLQLGINPPLNSNKSKTIFSEKQIKENPATFLLNPLPWVSSGKYLGNTLTSIQNGYQQEEKEKRARYIEQNCEINQEFAFAHPQVNCQINRI